MTSKGQSHTPGEGSPNICPLCCFRVSTSLRQAWYSLGPAWSPGSTLSGTWAGLRRVYV